MKLDTYQPGVKLPLCLHPQKWPSEPEQTLSELKCQSSRWVKLQEQPSPYSHDEALLLCQHSDTEWIAWVPDYGEIAIHRCQFHEISE